MAVTTDTTAAIRPLTLETADSDLDELGARIAAARWPPKEPVENQSWGVQLTMVEELARHWEHARSEHAGELPLIVTQRRPGPRLHVEHGSSS
jgi:hypothetical protein